MAQTPATSNIITTNNIKIARACKHNFFINKIFVNLFSCNLFFKHKEYQMILIKSF